MKAYVIKKITGMSDVYSYDNEIMGVYLDKELCRKQKDILVENNTDDEVEYFISEFEINQLEE